MMRSREWQLRRRPEGVPSPSDVELVEVEVPEPGPGQVAIANRVLSVEPYMWGRMSAAGTYADPYQIGETMTGHAVGVVTASRAEAIPVGATVLHEQGWREHGVLDAGSVRVLDDPLVPDAAWLGVLGVTGFTAYVALHMIAACRPGETVFVSAAAGAVGSTAVQLAKAQGCRVIGSAGSAEKVAFVRDELGADAAFSYRTGPVREGLRGALLAAAEEGIDVYVDNVGGEHLEAALRYIRPFGRVALCGAISAYGNPPSPGPRNLLRAIWQRVRLEGFIVGDHEPRRPDFERAMSRLLRSGAVRGIETASAGIESAFDTFTAMLGGAGIGKSVVRLD